MSIVNMHHFVRKHYLLSLHYYNEKKAVLILGKGKLVFLVYKESMVHVEEILNFEAVNCSILK